MFFMARLARMHLLYAVLYHKCCLVIGVVIVVDVQREKCLRLDNEKYRSDALLTENVTEVLSSLEKATSEMLSGKF